MYVKGCAAKLLATLSVLFSPTYHSLRIRGDLFPSAVAELLSFHDLPLHPLPLFASNDVSLGPTEEVREEEAREAKWHIISGWLSTFTSIFPWPW